MGQGDVYLKAEGVYTTWTLQVICDTGVVFGSWDSIIGIRDDGQVVWVNETNDIGYIIDSDGNIRANFLDIGSAFPDSMRRQSLLSKYILFVNGDEDSIIVQSGIVKLWERKLDDDKGEYALASEPAEQGCAISPSGEWIAVAVNEAVTSNGLIFIYKGN